MLCSTLATLIVVVSYSVYTIAKRNNSKNKMKNLGKKIAREVGLGLAGMAIGDANAKNVYKVGAKLNKTRKFVGSFKKGGRVPATGLALVHKGEVVVPNQPQRSANMRLFSQPTSKGLSLSIPALAYLKSFIDPFDSAIKCVGTPRPGSMPSYKVTGFVRGTGIIGAKGVGFVAFSPCLVNDVACVTYSNSSAYNSEYMLSLPTDWNGGTSNFTPATSWMSNLPYTYNTLIQTVNNTTARAVVEGRIVSASLKVYYTGTTLNQSGQYYAYVDPDFETVLSDNHLSSADATGGYTPTLLGTKDATEIKYADRSGIQIIYIPPTDNLSDYPQNNNSAWRKAFPYSNNLTQGPTNSGIGVPPGGIMITGVAGAQFYFEAITHCEYIGPGVPQALLTPSFSDSVGYDAVQMLLSRAQRRAASDARKSLRQCIMEEARADGIRF